MRNFCSVVCEALAMMGLKGVIPQLLLCQFLFTGGLTAQPLGQKLVLEIYEDNDFFNLLSAGTDRYYTNGTKLLLHVVKNKTSNVFPENLMLKLPHAETSVYSWGLSQSMFTPENISKDQVDQDDWPYAGVLYLLHAVNSFQPDQGRRLKSEFFLGIMGPASFAAETQKFIHNALGFVEPNGWDWQINNYPVVNYNLELEQRLWSKKHFETSTFVGSMTGSLMNQMKLGLNFRIGSAPSVGLHASQRAHLSLNYGVASGYVLYNAFLEGGFFDRKRYERGISKGYRLSPSDINHFFIENQLKFNCSIGRFELSYAQKFLSSQTKTTSSHSVGNITLRLRL